MLIKGEIIFLQFHTEQKFIPTLDKVIAFP